MWTVYIININNINTCVHHIPTLKALHHISISTFPFKLTHTVTRYTRLSRIFCQFFMINLMHVECQLKIFALTARHRNMREINWHVLHLRCHNTEYHTIRILFVCRTSFSFDSAFLSFALCYLVNWPLHMCTHWSRHRKCIHKLRWCVWWRAQGIYRSHIRIVHE